MARTTESARLRVVGQELEQKKVTDFEVFVEPKGYRVVAQLPSAPPPTVREPKWPLGRLFAAKRTPPVPDAPAENWEQTYSPAELDRLDDEYRARRRASGSPDDYAVSQVLRVIGAFVDKHRLALAGVGRERQWIEIRHRDEHGQVQSSRRKYAELYDFSFHLYKSRQSSS